MTADGRIHEFGRDAIGFCSGLGHQLVQATQDFMSTEIRVARKDPSHDASSFPYDAYVVFGGCQERSVAHVVPKADVAVYGSTSETRTGSARTFAGLHVTSPEGEVCDRD
ncbi:hypothetical protein [Streptomyces sp.]|uniref:hypothetical protein n=1 Tax=Streptomyces sp. TaxID=1931 RepID=UPI002F9224D2